MRCDREEVHEYDANEFAAQKFEELKDLLKELGSEIKELKRANAAKEQNMIEKVQSPTISKSGAEHMSRGDCTQHAQM